jgi:hypothetical protein
LRAGVPIDRDHVRASADRKHTTVREHLPSSHRRYADWTPERFRRQARQIGGNTSAFVEIILQERAHRARLPCLWLRSIGTGGAMHRNKWSRSSDEWPPDQRNRRLAWVLDRSGLDRFCRALALQIIEFARIFPAAGAIGAPWPRPTDSAFL